MILNTLKSKPLHYLVMHKIHKVGGIIIPDKLPIIIPIGFSINGEGIILTDYSTSRTKFNIDTVNEDGEVDVPYTAPSSKQHIFMLEYTKKLDLIQTALEAFLNVSYVEHNTTYFSFISPIAFIPKMLFTGSNESMGQGDTRAITLTFTEDMSRRIGVEQKEGEAIRYDVDSTGEIVEQEVANAT